MRDADEIERSVTAYFEMMTNRAIYQDGWVAAARFGVPWQTAGREGNFLNSPWELYNVDEDFSEADDVASEYPDKLKALQAVFDQEAAKYDVYPLDSRMSERMDPKLRSTAGPRTSWTYHGNKVWLPEPIGPQLFPQAHTITAEIIIPDGGAEGVITCAGGFSAGWSLYVMNRKPVFRYTLFDIADITIPGTIELPSGKVMLKTEFTPDGSKEGGGILKLFVNGKPAGAGTLTRTAFRHGLEPFEVGRDSITSIDPAYKSRGQFPFTGSIETLTFALMQK